MLSIDDIVRRDRQQGSAACFDGAEADCHISPCQGRDPYGSAALIQAIRGRARSIKQQTVEKSGRFAEVRDMQGSATMIKRSVRIAGHATSVSLEPPFWRALLEIAAQRGVSVNALVAAIDIERSGNLSSALRVFILERCRSGELGISDAPPLEDSSQGTTAAAS
jgi:predicted DNA-binding ribbon-helix-helix protein